MNRWAASVGAAAAMAVAVASATAAPSAKRLDTAKPVPMVPLAGSVQNPCFSPSGDRLVVTQWLDGYNGEADADDEDFARVLVISRARGRVVALLSEERTTAVNLPGSCWSKRTDRITYSAAIDGPDRIFTVAGDGSGRTQIAGDAARALFEPSFSPDGEWIVFESHPYDQEKGGELWKVRADGSRLTRLTHGRDDRQPNWSPRGDRIVFQRSEKGRWDIWTIDVNGGRARNVTRSRVIDETDVAWSPSGRWLVYSQGGDGIDVASLFTIGADGRGRRQLTRTRNWYDGAPTWSYDGRTIAFEARAGEPDGSSGTRIYSIASPAGRR